LNGVVKHTKYADDTIISFEECDSIDAIVGDGHIFKRLGNGLVGWIIADVCLELTLTVSRKGAMVDDRD
jgi:hypothetical protein